MKYFVRISTIICSKEIYLLVDAKDVDDAEYQAREHAKDIFGDYDNVFISDEYDDTYYYSDYYSYDLEEYDPESHDIYLEGQYYK